MSQTFVLLFDLGGVLLENVAFIRLQQLVPAGHEIARLKDMWLQSPAVRRFELGTTSPMEFARGFLAEWELELSPEQFLTEFSAWPTGLYPRARQTIRALRHRHCVACLSNSNRIHWEKFNGFQGLFDHAISSHQIGAIKPDEDAFAKALEICGARPEQVRFFDDALTNVAAARRLGIPAFHVEGFAALLTRLHAENLL